MTQSQVRFLSDEPVSKDDFGGSFERVANGIVETIRSGDADGKMIGLEGSWGSGKSSIVKMVQKGLEVSKDKEQTGFFVFDAWAHQGDPLRRSFLESLIDDLGEANESAKAWLQLDAKWIDRISVGRSVKTTWKQVKEGLANRLKRDVTTLTPSISGFAVLLMIYVWLVPVCLIFANNEKVTNGWKTIAYFVALPIWPFFVWAIRLAISWSFLKNIFKKENWVGLKGDGIKKTESTTIQSPDPTSIEFEYYFSELVRQSLQNQHRRLVIVIDNLDRVDAKDAASIWATMQTFMPTSRNLNGDHGAKGEGQGNQRWQEKVTFILPYDPDGIRSLWDGRREFVGKKKVDENEEDKRVEETQGRRGSDIEQSFIEKTFIARFRTPPPVLSDWRRFLGERIKRALGEKLDERIVEKIIGVFDLWRIEEESILTPREIKLFVNQLVTLHRQWPSEDLLPSMAYFVLLNRSGNDVIISLSLREKGIPDGTMVRFIGERVTEDIAGLAFNVNGKKGMELLLGPMISKAMFSGNGEELKGLEQKFEDGFWAVMDATILEVELAAKDFTQTLQGAVAVQGAGWLESEFVRAKEVRKVGDALISHIEYAGLPPRIDGQIRDGLIAMGVMQGEKDGRETVIKSLRHILTQEDGDEAISPEIQSRSAQQAASVLGQMDLEGYGDKLKNEPLCLNVSAKEWVNVCEYLISSKIKMDIWNYIEPGDLVNEGTISTQLGDACKGNGFKEKYLNCLYVTTHKCQDYLWQEVCEALKERLEDCDPDFSIITLQHLVYGLFYLRNMEIVPAVEAVTTLAKMGYLLHWIFFVEQMHDLAMLLALTFLRECPDQDAKSHPGSAAQGANWLEQLLSSEDEEQVSLCASIMKEYKYHDVLRILLKKGEAPPVFAKKVMEKLCDEANGDDSVWKDIEKILEGSKAIIGQWSTMQDMVDAEHFVLILNHFIDQCGLIEEIKDCDFDYENGSGLYRWILEECQPNEDKKFAEWCQGEISKIVDENVWKEVLIEDKYTDLFQLMVWLEKNDYQPRLGTGYMEALFEYAKLLATNEVEESGAVFKELMNLPNYIENKEIRKSFRKKLMLWILGNSSKIPSDSFFNAFGEELLYKRILTGVSGDPGDFFYEIIHQSNSLNGAVSWLGKLFDKFSDVFDVLKKANKSDGIENFKDVVLNDSKNSDLPEDFRLEMERFSKVLGFENESKNEDISDEEESVVDAPVPIITPDVIQNVDKNESNTQNGNTSGGTTTSKGLGLG